MISPMMISGVIAAVARAAIDHQRVPCEPVCPANRSGRVGASAPVKTTAKKYSFQEKTRARMNAATNPGAAIGTTMRRNACQIEAPSTRAACSSSTGIELIAHDPDNDREVDDRVDKDETGAGVQEVQLPIQDKDRQCDRHRWKNQ